MNGLHIEETKSTPAVRFEPASGELRIEGQSYPENAFNFYEPVLTWVDGYWQQTGPPGALTVIFQMPYVNTSSSKCIMMLLDKLEDAHQAGHRVAVRWYYDRENESALECAEEFREDLTLPFAISPLDE